LNVGETFTITLRDNPRPTWIDSPTPSVWARGVENWWDNNPQGWWGRIDAAHEDWRDFPTYELTLEVVGVYWFTPPFFTNFTSAEIFIPAGVMPEGFGWDDSPHLTGMYSFVLDSPRSEEAFLRQTRTALAEQGFVALFMPNRFDALAAAIDPIYFSITINLIVFGLAALLIFVFVVYLYIRQWRKSIAIAQALGTPPSTVLRRLFAPVIIFWMPAVVVGSVLAWSFALTQAQATLERLASYETEVLLASHWLGVFIVAIITFILIGTLLAGYNVVHSPVLTQLQGGTQRRVKHIDPGVVPDNFVVGSFTLKPMTTNPGAARAASRRHSLRHMIRTPIKTALALVLSLLLVFSLGWLNDTITFTESEIQRLWETTIIEGEIFRTFDHDSQTTSHAVISPSSWDLIERSGFLSDMYLEAVASVGYLTVLGVSHLSGLIAENTKTITDEQLGVICDDMEIEFMPGFSAEDFVYSPDTPIPLILRRYMPEEWELPLDEPFPFFLSTAQIIGVFDGGLQRAANRFGETMPLFIMPVEDHREQFSGQWPFYGWGSIQTYRAPYMTARFTIDPARNREIEQFRGQVEPFLRDNTLGVQGAFPLLLMVNDDIIYDVILPMEQNLSLLRVLYPIAISVAFALAIGMSLLTMLQNTKNAAIMRALGKPKVNVQFTLCTEQIIVSITGVLLGLGVLFIIGTAVELTPFVLAGMYIGGIVIGSAIGAFIINAKTPIDLLQVRE